MALGCGVPMRWHNANAGADFARDDGESRSLAGVRAREAAHQARANFGSGVGPNMFFPTINPNLGFGQNMLQSVADYQTQANQAAQRASDAAYSAAYGEEMRRRGWSRMTDEELSAAPPGGITID
jgi:hypothetical protein